MALLLETGLTYIYSEIGDLLPTFMVEVLLYIKSQL
jgi:hypothetical protein